MNREQKAAAVEEIAARIGEADAVLAIDYRGISVPEAAELRGRLREAGASFRVVKNRLTLLAVERADAEPLREHLTGPTALTFVGGDVALAAKAIATFKREHEKLEFKGGIMDGEALAPDQIQAIARLPAREQLNAQLAGVVASPLTGLVRGLGSLLGGLASQLGQIRDQGLVGGEAEPAEAAAPEEAGEDESPEAAGEDEAPKEAGEDASTPEEPQAAGDDETEHDDEPAAQEGSEEDDSGSDDD